MSFLIFKTIHLVGVVSWFAGLFYLGRMFVYHRESFEHSEPKRSILMDQIALMESRVYKIIMNPAMMLSWFFGLLMIFNNGMDYFAFNTWLHFKIILVCLLTGYHLYCKKVMLGLNEGKMIMGSQAFRLFNEIPTIFLIAILALAVFKNTTNPLILLIVLVFIIILLILLTKLYKKMRDK